MRAHASHDIPLTKIRRSALRSAFGVFAFCVRHSEIGVLRYAFGVLRLVFGVWRSAFGILHSAFCVLRSAFGKLPLPLHLWYFAVLEHVVCRIFFVRLGHL